MEMPMIKPAPPPKLSSDRGLGNLDDMVRDPKYRDEYDDVARTLGYPEDRSYADDLRAYDDSGRLGHAIDQMRTLGKRYADAETHGDPEEYYFRRSALRNAARICDSFDMSMVKPLIDTFTEAANDYEKASSEFAGAQPRFEYEAYDIAGRIALHSDKLDYGEKENYSDLYED